MNKVNMAPEDLRKAQMLMLYIMKKVHEICVKNNIKYWLDYGTLLGAVRHNGFIPWDDDLDICMLREDYEKWNKIAQNELGDEFFWQTCDSEPNMPFLFGKVRLNGTLWYEEAAGSANINNNGVFIDIFPYDNYPENKFMQYFILLCSRFCRGILGEKIFKWSCKNKVYGAIKRCLLLPFSIKFAKKNQKRILNYLSHTDSNLVTKLCMDTMRDLSRKSMFSTLILHKFEDAEFFVPRDFDKRLKLLFGDYMILPPVEKRGNKHEISEYFLG